MDPSALVDHLFRRQAGQMVATLTRTLGPRHLTLAEDAVQDALITAMQQWPFRGIPDNPEAWLFQVARNRALDRLRHVRMAIDKEPAIARASAAVEPPGEAPLLRHELPPFEDDQLGLLFLACHPSLAAEARVALALKLVGGFSAGEIARALLSQESAVAQRLVRAKRQLRDQAITYGMPEPRDLPARLDSVLDSLYLMFNEGYAATTGDHLIRDDVAREAIRLACMIETHPAIAAPRASALVALMLLHAARFPARVDSEGTLFLLRDQVAGSGDESRNRRVPNRRCARRTGRPRRGRQPRRPRTGALGARATLADRPAFASRIINGLVEYLIKQYALEPGAWEIQYIEEYFGEYPRRKTADEIITRLRDRESLILMAEAPLPDDPSGALVPVSYKIVHEIRADEADPKLRDLVTRLGGAVKFDGRRILYQWIGGTRRDWRGQGHFRALTEESEVWAMGAGFEEVVVKAKNRYYDMRAVLAQLQFNVVKHDPHPTDAAESKLYFSKLLPAEIARAHRSVRTVVYAE